MSNLRYKNPESLVCARKTFIAPEELLKLNASKAAALEITTALQDRWLGCHAPLELNLIRRKDPSTTVFWTKIG